ncbi:LANO_0H22694g1_1 [Lachancea nothofagi CBS 11611]|uniref:Biogenesis of lysosome-related organelles complex 1 subunit CNL1 n=1 Tax=Lachancea nothofagi CBS 11611 TaxID=1266666 RepID=A0A1G4KNX4_9SACH|nr:LANO_0H22694g1_1 [Lachancea nothofagi CBS 11611]
MVSEELESAQEPRDPFRIDQLCVDYDYLLYKIQDYVSSIQLKTIEICEQQNRIIEEGILKEIIDVNVCGLQEVLLKCEELEAHFDMLDQIDVIAQSFGPRLQQIVKEHKELQQR